MMGRPTKLTQDVQRRIVTAIKQGATYELAAQYGGVSYDTFNNWMKRGQEDAEGEFVQFFETIKRAEGEAVLGWLKRIETAARDGNWQAAAWKLERRYPRDYGRQVQEHSGVVGVKIEYVNDWRQSSQDSNQPDGTD